MRVFKKFTVALSLYALLLAAMPLSSLAQVGNSTATSAAKTESSYVKALAAIESKVEKRRAELGIPGMSLAIVKDGEVIYSKGLGYKDFEKKVPVTADTQFAIGSATKAFTALSVLMSQDAGKLSLDDSPKKLLPYFKMYDAEADKAITIRDLLSHSSGLNRTDLAMITGKLNRAELIQVAAQAKPTAKLREKFQYQNIMYTAAGEIVTQAEKMPWERFVPERIFKPLGMTNSNMRISEMEKARDRSLGYDYNFDTKETKLRPYRVIDEVAPAGSINSSANDMAKWVQFVLAGGVAGGKRLVSEKSFEEWLKPQMKINPAGTSNYGLGWFLQKWNGLGVVQHGGNIDGFNSLVAMIPEKKLGFVMLTNVSGSSMGADIMPVIFSAMLEDASAETPKPAAAALSPLVGKYGTPERSIEIKLEGSDLFIIVPGQPAYKLVATGERVFRAEGLPDGFGAKFTPGSGPPAELELIQPQGNRKLARVSADEKVTAAPAAAARELVGKYTPPGSTNAVVEIKGSDSAVTFNIPGQQPYTLTPRADGSFAMSPLPETYFLNVKRDGTRIAAVVVTQPEGVFEFKRADPSAESPIKITVDELHAKTVEALGGEAAWRKITTRYTETDIDLVHQGVQGRTVGWAKAPNMSAAETTMTALGKTIATGWEFFDGKRGTEAYSFAPTSNYEGKRLDDAKLQFDFYGPLDWKTAYKKVEITGIQKVNGEDAYVVAFEPKAGTNFREFYSITTFLPLRREGVVPSSTSSQQTPFSTTYSDYREVDGIKLPFRTVNNTVGNGDVINTLKVVKHNIPIDDKLFGPKK